MQSGYRLGTQEEEEVGRVLWFHNQGSVGLGLIKVFVSESGRCTGQPQTSPVRKT